MNARKFALVPGAGGMAWYWHRVVAELTAAGREAIAIDLPGADEQAGLAEYRDIVLKSATGGDVLVAQSLGGFTAARVCERITPAALVFVNAMIPQPGETAGQWGENVGSTAARLAAADAGGYTRDFDEQVYFLHDVPPEALAGGSEPRPEADRIFGDPCAFTRWPDIPTHALIGADDRLFPLDLQQRIARDRLGLEADVIPGGHLVALSNPKGVAEYLLAVADSVR
ncbi:alpha/beta hydrolase [Nocardia sp. SYP-A9097]|uniref:alpha/beta fold hydrolase n=1 Tax=Nocardia sp. SYP-A9097 TaxID=2663237 RepID=UPI0028158CD9|nr:alpha/beta hydrolase [Nocardia sp. SYP-A9097]